MPWEPNKLERERLDKLNHLREKGIDPFPGEVRRTHSAVAAIAAYEAAERDGKVDHPIEVVVCGRIRSVRVTGKISFSHIEDGTGKIQLFIRQDQVGEDTYEIFKRDLDLGDFVEATGTMMRTKAGEISVMVTKLKVLAKALSPLPVIKERK